MTVHMGIKRRSINLEPHRNVRKSTHLIAEYKVSESKIWCDCGWEGPEPEFQDHRKEQGALKSQRRRRASASKALTSA